MSELFWMWALLLLLLLQWRFNAELFRSSACCTDLCTFKLNIHLLKALSGDRTPVWASVVSCPQLTAGGAAPAVWPPGGCAAPFPETHTSGLGRTHPVTSVRFEEEESLNSNCAAEEEEGRKVLPGFLSLLSRVWILRLWKVSRLRVNFSEASRGAQRVAFLKSGGCQLQTRRTGSGRDTAVSSHFSLLTLRCQAGASPHQRTERAPGRIVTMQTPPNFRKESVVGRKSQIGFDLTAWFQPNYDFRVL